MAARAVALLSGGLDSMLAIRVLQEQGLEVEALNFQTTFTCCKDTAAQAARELGVRLTAIAQEDDYLQLVRKPKYGYGKGANPCVDCRIYMFRMAKAYARDVGAEVVVSGEVLGQRPKSQKRRDLGIIAHESGLDDRLLRPLSARLLPPTRPELDGVVDRERLYGFWGRGRKPLIALARQFGFKDIPSPSTGCALTEPSFAPKVHDLVQLDSGSSRWDFELLNVGRHLRLNRATKGVVGRREEENLIMQHMYRAPDRRASALLVPETFSGPTVLLLGSATSEAIEFALGLVDRYSKPASGEALVRLTIDEETSLVAARPAESATKAVTL